MRLPFVSRSSYDAIVEVYEERLGALRDEVERLEAAERQRREDKRRIIETLLEWKGLPKPTFLPEDDA